jgi:predicted transcriptional regulator
MAVNYYKRDTDKFTDLETQVLDTLIEGLYAEPGFSDVDVHDIARDISTLPTKIIRGVLGSLVKKGIITIDRNDGGYDIIYLNESHWYLHPEWKLTLT